MKEISDLMLGWTFLLKRMQEKQKQVTGKKFYEIFLSTALAFEVLDPH